MKIEGYEEIPYEVFKHLPIEECGTWTRNYENSFYRKCEDNSAQNQRSILAPIQTAEAYNEVQHRAKVEQHVSGLKCEVLRQDVSALTKQLNELKRTVVLQSERITNLEQHKPPIESLSIEIDEDKIINVLRWFIDPNDQCYRSTHHALKDIKAAIKLTPAK